MDQSQEVGKLSYQEEGYYHISLTGEPILLGNRTQTWNLEKNLLKSQMSQFFQAMELTHRNFLKNQYKFYLKCVSLYFSLA